MPRSFHNLVDAFYDLLLLDYGGIGPRFGNDEGLDVLRYLKRVNPSLRILAFTARTFDASKADFFRICDGVVKKDAGIRETLEQIELHLSEVLTPAYQFSALAQAIGVTSEQRTTGSNRRFRRLLSEELTARKRSPLQSGSQRQRGKAGRDNRGRRQLNSAQSR